MNVVLPLLALTAAAVLVGCQSHSRSQEVRTSGESTRGAAKVEQTTLARAASYETTAMPSPEQSGRLNWTSMAYPTGDPKTSVVGIDKGLPREVRLNQPFDYELTIKNLTRNELQDVVVIEAPSENLKLSGLTPQARTGAGGGLTWALGTLAPDESRTVRATGVASKAGQVGTCTSISYKPQLCNMVAVVEPKLMLAEAGPAEALRCDAVAYTYKVTNAGTGTVRNVKVRQDLPDGLRTADGKRTVVFDAGDLAAGRSREFKLNVAPQRTGIFELAATATADGDLEVESNVVKTMIREPVLKITKSCPDEQFVGRPINAQITVTNAGDGVARDVVLEDTIPAGTEFRSASDGGRAGRGMITWNLGTLQPKASRTVSLSVNPTGVGSYAGDATVRAACARPASTGCATSVSGIPAILLEVVDVEDPVQVGGTETYVITLTNQGSAPGTNIRVVCTLEANQQYVSSTGATRGVARGREVTFEPIRSLGAKQKATFRLVTRAVSAGDVRFKVSMTSDQLTRPVEETEATNIYQ